MDPTGLSIAARALRNRIAGALQFQPGQVSIGHPQAAYKASQSSTAQHALNLFFYRVDSGSYPAAGDPGEPLYLRVYCLITPFAEADSGTSGASAGENDLRLAGLVAQTLHEKPLLDLTDGAGDRFAQLQVLQVPLSLDDINHLWATQPETPFRLSLAYELALVPLPPATPPARAPLVGAIGVDASVAGRSQRPPVAAPALEALTVDTGAPDWAPQIAFADADNRLLLTLALPRAALPSQVSLVCAGAAGAQADVVWQRWTRAAGWSEIEQPPQSPSVTMAAEHIVAGTSGVGMALDLPADPPPQLQLFLRRNWQTSGGASRSVLSNPLLLSIYPGSAP